MVFVNVLYLKRLAFPKPCTGGSSKQVDCIMADIFPDFIQFLFVENQCCFFHREYSFFPGILSQLPNQAGGISSELVQ